ncbi:Uncharacterised protein [Escherichia coli]|uniref:Uncharacterized protein n=1 Tax=Escherichia coli TaxID=562 RepID=A0A376NV12_ECOLX|nr:Uncharacterised protein [Escherichia coli]
MSLPLSLRRESALFRRRQALTWVTLVPGYVAFRELVILIFYL